MEPLGRPSEAEPKGTQVGRGQVLPALANFITEIGSPPSEDIQELIDLGRKIGLTRTGFTKAAEARYGNADALLTPAQQQVDHRALPTAAPPKLGLL